VLTSTFKRLEDYAIVREFRTEGLGRTVGIMYQLIMKKQWILVVFIALGAMTLSCEDANYDEVEQTVLDDQTSDAIDGEEQEKNKPGGG